MWWPPKLLFSLLCVTECKAHSPCIQHTEPNSEQCQISFLVDIVVVSQMQKSIYARTINTIHMSKIQTRYIHLHTHIQQQQQQKTHTKWPQSKLQETNRISAMEMKKTEIKTEQKKWAAMPTNDDGAIERRSRRERTVDKEQQKKIASEFGGRSTQRSRQWRVALRPKRKKNCYTYPTYIGGLRAKISNNI